MAPQSPQKRLLGGFSTLHLGQRFSSSAPQSPQNFLLTGFSLPQLEQRIGSPVITAIRASFIVLQEVRSPDAVADYASELQVVWTRTRVESDPRSGPQLKRRLALLVNTSFSAETLGRFTSRV